MILRGRKPILRPIQAGFPDRGSDTGRPDCRLTIKRVLAETEHEWPASSAEYPPEDVPSGRIQYVRSTAPEIAIPTWRGMTYEDTVPDIYDVSERARLAINVLTRDTNPRADYEQYIASILTVIRS